MESTGPIFGVMLPRAIVDL